MNQTLCSRFDNERARFGHPTERYRKIASRRAKTLLS